MAAALSGPVFSFRSHDWGSGYSTEMEKRQVFLRSYQFSRKKSVNERVKGTFVRVKRVIWFRLRSVKKLRRMVWSRIKNGFFFTAAGRRRRPFLRLHGGYSALYKLPSAANNNNNNKNSSSCFW